VGTGTLLVKGLLMSPPGIGSRMACRQANSFAADSHLLKDVNEAKVELRRLFNESAITRLERSWQDATPVTHVAQLKGEWHIQVPKTGNNFSLQSWMVRHGAPHGSKRLMSEPEISISPDGRAQFHMWVGYGHGSDEVRKPCKFEVIRPNVLRKFPGKVTTVRINVTFPAESPTDFRVTYLDDELMIVRDNSEFVYAYWRLSSRYMHRSRAVTQAEVVKGDSERAMHVDAAGVEETMQAERAVIESAGQRTARVVSAVVGLEEELKEHQMQLDYHAEQREELTAMLAAKDRELVDASKEVEEVSVQLRAVEHLRGRARGEETRRQAEESEKVAELERMKAQVAGLTERRLPCLSKLVRKETREASLRKQISIISRTQSGRRALSKARSELQEVRQEARALKRDEISLTRALQRVSLALEREQDGDKNRAAEDAQLEEQLQAWREELSERKAVVLAAVKHKSEICRQRDILLARLRELDRHDDAYKAEAAKVECLLSGLLASAKKARSTALCVQRHGNTIWPWSKV